MIKEGDTLVTYYMLPLVGVNKRVFGRKFKSSFISKSGDTVYIQLTSEMTGDGYTKTDAYKTNVVLNKKLFAIYEIPEEYRKEGVLFTKGLYSQFSAKAKKVIYNGSTLPYNKVSGDFKVSSPILQALDKTKVLRGYLKTMLGITEIPESKELIDTPHKEWFIESHV